MAVRKICKPKGCRARPRCDHPWWFDVMHEGKRWRMRVDEFAIARGAPEPVASKQTAERVWEPRFIAELMAGKDPRVSPTPPRQEGVFTVATFLDQYFTNYVEAEGLKSVDTIGGHIKALILKRRGELGRYAFVSAHQKASSRTASRPLGNPCCSSPRGTRPSEQSPASGSIARSCGRSTFIGTTSVTKVPADCWRTASTSALSS